MRWTVVTISTPIFEINDSFLDFLWKMNSFRGREQSYYEAVSSRNSRKILQYGYLNLLRSDGVLHSNHRKMIQRLRSRLDQGSIETLFREACKYGYVDVARDLMGEIYPNLIRTIIRERRVDTFQFILTHPNIDFTEPNLLSVAARLPNNKGLQFILHRIGEKEFRRSLKKFRLISFNIIYRDNIRFLIKYGLDLNLSLANSIVQGRESNIGFLVSQGANIHQKADLLIRKAILYKWPKIIQYLYDQGCRPTSNIFKIVFGLESQSTSELERMTETVHLTFKLFPASREQIIEAYSQASPMMKQFFSEKFSTI